MYQSGRLEVAVIYGRRRVGKTTLISEFCKDKRTVFFAAQENSARQNLEELSEAVGAADEGEHSEDGVRFSFQSFRDAFLRIAQMARSERLVLVIDEYPYLAQAERWISSLLQNFLDHQFKETRLFLILCGSSMSFMENQVPGYQSPLYGRRTAQFKILPFDYRETGEWFPEYSCEEMSVEKYLSDYMGLTFERMCRDYILYYDERLPFAVGAVGQWWGGHPQTHKQAQIDVVVTAADEDCGIVGSCKFKNRLVSEEELNLLEDYAKAMGAFSRNYYYLFSKTGFTDLLKRRAAETGVRLVTLDEMY